MNTYKKCISGFFATLTLFVATAVLAEDIELFMMDPSINNGLPNVLVIIDNQSNWNSSSEFDDTTAQNMIYEAVRAVLLGEAPVDEHGNIKSLLNDDGTAKINLGVMNLVHATAGSPRGGRVVSAIAPLNAARQSATSGLYQRIVGDEDGDGKHVKGGMRDNLDSYWRSSNSDYGLLMNEAYRYFAGMSPSSGTPASGLWDKSAIQGNKYISPVDPENPCSGNYIIFIATGHPTNDSTGGGSALASYGGDTTPIPLNPNSYQSSWGDEFARFMASASADPTINTIVVDVHDVPETNEEGEIIEKKTPQWHAVRAYWKSIAAQGKGEYFAVGNSAKLIDALTKSFDSVLSVNNVFAASSLPVSVNVRGTNLNQVYMGVFRPDPDKKPRWMGNLKLYQLGLDTGTSQIYLADANKQRADSPTNGFIHEHATSFWSKPSSFWTGKDMAVYRHASDAPDGDIVEKGGAAQRLREDWQSRTLLTCTGTCVGDPVPFTAESSALPEALVEWLRGADNVDNENPLEYENNVRASIHGDVLHSRPAVMNYGGDTDIVVFYGANDGTFRALRGGFDTDGGTEFWSFIPPEFYDRLNNLYTNTEIASKTGKPYFMDGGIGTYHETNDGKIEKAWIFPSMRRGGRTLYAFDVSDYENPSILWRRSHTDDGFEALGQTWSNPRVVRTMANEGKPVLFFGGGYDAAYEDALPREESATMGNTVYMVDAETGAVLWTAAHADMDYSIPSDVTLIGRHTENRRYGVVDRAYVGDTGGNVWRIDMYSADTSEWKVHKLASLGSNRKFLYPPDVVYDPPEYDAILIGSGDREKPHDVSVANGFFMLKNIHKDPTRPWDIAESVETIVLDDLYDATENKIQEGANPEAEQALLDESRGWVIHYGSGEKTVGGAVTLSGTTFFSTHQPQAAAPGSCSSNLGIARNYALSFRNATATREQDGQQGLTKSDRSEIIPGGGFIPTPVPVMVEIDGELREVVLRGTQVDEGGTEQVNRRVRTYWYKEYE